MNVVPTELDGVLILEPTLFADDRGFLFESWNERRLAEAGVRARFVQDNHSRSLRNVLRGLHYQIACAQGKLVRVVAGEIFDVAVDIRRGSPTFGRSVSFRLSADAQLERLAVPLAKSGYGEYLRGLLRQEVRA